MAFFSRYEVGSITAKHIIAKTVNATEDIDSKMMIVNFICPARESLKRAMIKARIQLATIAQNPNQPL